MSLFAVLVYNEEPRTRGASFKVKDNQAMALATVDGTVIAIEVYDSTGRVVARNPIVPVYAIRGDRFDIRVHDSRVADVSDAEMEEARQSLLALQKKLRGYDLSRG